MTKPAIAASAAVDVDYDAMPTLGDIPRYYAVRKPHGLAIWFESRKIDWQTLEMNSNRVANALLASGIRRGDRVVFVGKGNDEFFELMFGAAKIGAVFVPVGWRLAAPEIVQIVDDAEASILLVGLDQLDRMDVFHAGLPRMKSFIVMETSGAGLPTFAGWRDAHPAVTPDLSIDPGDVAL